MSTPLRIGVFSIHPLTFPRDTVCLEGLRERGHKLTEHVIQGQDFFRKMKELVRVYRNALHDYDVIYVAYVSGLLVPLLALLSRKPIFFNTLCSAYEGIILDRCEGKASRFLAFRVWMLDFIIYQLSDRIFVETDSQKEFMARTFFLSPKKLVRMWTSVNRHHFFPMDIKKRDIFTVIFRGAFLPFVGVEYVIEAARLLKADSTIRFLIAGRGMLQHRLETQIQESGLQNIELLTRFLKQDELRALLCSCHVSLGQLSNHPRTERTIPNKTFESLATGIPFITAATASNKELLTPEEDCLFVEPASPKAIVAAVLRLKQDQGLVETLRRNGFGLCDRTLSPTALAQTFETTWEHYS